LPDFTHRFPVLFSFTRLSSFPFLAFGFFFLLFLLSLRFLSDYLR
jgi:hypothetical protein